jgi:hypothetical protein
MPKRDAQKRHQEVLDMIEKLSDITASERALTVSNKALYVTRCIPTVS